MVCAVTRSRNRCWQYRRTPASYNSLTGRNEVITHGLVHHSRVFTVTTSFVITACNSVTTVINTSDVVSQSSVSLLCQCSVTTVAWLSTRRETKSCGLLPLNTASLKDRLPLLLLGWHPSLASLVDFSVSEKCSILHAVTLSTFARLDVTGPLSEFLP